MADDIKYVATNLRLGCNGQDCFGCAYLDHQTGYCSADDEIKDCDYCKNAFTDKRLDDDNDLSYTAIGNFENGYGVLLRVSAAYKPPFAIIFQMYRKELKRNIDIACYAPTYCPICGRKIVENESYLKNKNCTAKIDAEKNNIASSCIALKAENGSKAQLVVMRFCPHSEGRNLQENKTHSTGRNLIGAKVYFDGSQWIAIPHTERPYRKRGRARERPNENELVAEFEQAFKKAKGKRRTRKETLVQEFKPLFENEERASETDLHRNLREFVKDNYIGWFKTDTELAFYALQLHSIRIFDSPQWISYIKFNQKYRPEIFGKKI